MLAQGQEAIIAEGQRRKGKFLPEARRYGTRVFASDNSLYLMRALMALKDANFQIPDCVWRPASQMRIAAAVFTTKRSNKLLVLHKEGMLVHNRPPSTARVRGMPAILGARPALRRPGHPTRRPWSWGKVAGKGRRHALGLAFRSGHIVWTRIVYPRPRLFNPTLLRLRKPDTAVGTAVSLKLTKPGGSGYSSRKPHWLSATWAQRR